MLTDLPASGYRWANRRMSAAVGGPARRRVVILLACVLGLQTADQGTVGALAGQLEVNLHASNTQIGLLVSATSVVGAVFTIPMGVLTDRVRRVPLLYLSILTWAAAMLASAAASSYLSLLITRLALGAVTATAGPAVASLAGDFFPAAERGRLYGFVLAGELLGSGFGFLVSGLVGASLGWRVGFAVLALPAIGLAFALWRGLPEPVRGGQGWLRRGEEHVEAATRVDSPAPAGGRAVRAGKPPRRAGLVQRLVRERGVRPKRAQVLHEDLAGMSLWSALRYVLAIRTNVALIAASALGYFFFAGLRTFAIVYVEAQFKISQGVASLLVVIVGAGALAGVLVGGRYADRLIRRGRINGRLIVAGVTYLVSAVIFVPGLLAPSIAIALPFFVLAAFFLGAPNPPLDAARLDIMPARLWGRAEAVRTVLRTGAEAVAPVLFGFVADRLGSSTTGGGPSGVGGFSRGAHLSGGGGLADTFLIMLVPLAASGWLILRTRNRYLTDVATAGATERATSPETATPEATSPEATSPETATPETAGRPAGAQPD